MKKCESCNKNHDGSYGSGRFCSAECARSFSRSKRKPGRKKAKCGWNKKNVYIDKCMLDIHHIDGNKKNNKEDKLVLLCPNCHSLTENYRYINGKNRKSASIV